MSQNIGAYFKKHIYLVRNELMAERIVGLLNSHQNTSFFFAFGAAHFLGPNSVVDILTSSGFTVTRVSADTIIKANSTNNVNLT